jgi:1,2-dihydroxy-3-keto-5-methylthiopentene dioxygenase
MAKLLRQNKEFVKGSVNDFLNKFEIEYQKWDDSSLPLSFKGPIKLSAEQQLEVLKSFNKEIETLKNKYAYVQQDIVTLTSETENLEVILDKFRPEHHHNDDEVRYIVDGEGVFSIFPESDESFDIFVESGDLLRVPKGTRHSFDLTDKKFIKAIRLFKDANGWAAIYDKN